MISPNPIALYYGRGAGTVHYILPYFMDPWNVRPLITCKDRKDELLLRLSGFLLVNGGTRAGSLCCAFAAEESGTSAASGVRVIEPVLSMGRAQYCLNQPTDPFH
jgi:hypothetical protein